MQEAGAQTLERVGVVTVDDQPFFRRAAHDVVEATCGFVPLAELASGAEALALLAELAPHLMLVDLRMPDMDGIETTRRVKAAQPAVVVFLISIESPANAPAGVGTSGAAAFVRKQDFKPRVLRDLWRTHGSPGAAPGARL